MLTKGLAAQAGYTKIFFVYTEDKIEGGGQVEVSTMFATETKD
jgi:hypothetical protein